MEMAPTDDEHNYKQIEDSETFNELEHEHEYEEHQESPSQSNTSAEDASTVVAANNDSLPESNVTTNNSKEDIDDTETLLLENIASSDSNASGSHGADGGGDTVNTTINNHNHNHNHHHHQNNKNRKTSSSSSTLSSNRSSKSRSNKQGDGATGESIELPANQQSQPLPPTPTSTSANTNQTLSAESITTQTTTASTINMKFYASKIAEGKEAIEKKDYNGATIIFSECIDLDPKDYLLYGYRSKTYFKRGHYQQSLFDAVKAIELNPKWTEAYYRQGISLFHMEQHADSLAAFAFGLSQDQENERMLDRLIRTARESIFGENLEHEYRQLVKRGLHKTPFVVMSVIGHELLYRHHHGQAIVIMESALKIGTSSPKMIGAVMSALSSAYWSLKNYHKAIEYMQKDLQMQIHMNDISGQCRVFGNLGFAYYILRKFKESLKAHRKQLELAMAIKHEQQQREQAVIALNALGHIHVALNDLSSALQSHTRCLQLLKQIGDNDGALSRELACVGHIYTLMEEYDKAREHHSEHIKLTNSSSISRHEECQTNLVLATSNLAFLAMRLKNYDEARTHHEQVIKFAQRLGGRTGKIYEMRACGGLGHTFRLSNRFSEAKKWFQRQLDLSRDVKDKIGEGQALCNLAMIAQQNHDHERASKLFTKNYKCIEEKNPYLSAYANSYTGSVYFSMKQYEESIHFYKESLASFEEFDGCSAEAATINVNISQAYEKLGEFDTALAHCQRSKQYR